jgi:hypothetical protein
VRPFDRQSVCHPPLNGARQCLSEHVSAATYTHTKLYDSWSRCCLYGPFPIKGLISSERKVGHYLLQKPVVDLLNDASSITWMTFAREQCDP